MNLTYRQFLRITDPDFFEWLRVNEHRFDHRLPSGLSLRAQLNRQIDDLTGDEFGELELWVGDLSVDWQEDTCIDSRIYMNPFWNCGSLSTYNDGEIEDFYTNRKTNI